MGLIDIRDLVVYPPGDNATDTIIHEIHFNKTALQYWNYTLYDNKTLSNESKCWLIFDDYKPFVLSNGTFINGTSCYSPILPLATRGRIGAVFAALFGLCIFITLIQLKKHGQQFLREDKRFRLVGRRWQWYWMLFVGACGLISCITGIDVDRNYLQDLALILQCFFFMMMGQGTVAAVWEGVRHWGSWQERQIVDRDPFSLPQDDRRGRMEFYMPLIFYLFGFMSFFLTAPRSWSKIPRQGGAAQQNAVAKPQATDGRFKAGAIFLGIAWLVILYCVQHNLLYYRLRAHPSLPMPARRSTVSVATAIRHLPLRFSLSIIIVAVYIGYGIVAAWNFDISLLKYDVWPGWPFALAYTPVVLVLLTLGISGFFEQNEDKQLIQQRNERGRRADESLGIVHKPSWWDKARGKHHADDMSRLRGLIADENITSHNTTANKRGSRTSRGHLPNALELSRLDESGFPRESPTEPRGRDRNSSIYSPTSTNTSSFNSPQSFSNARPPPPYTDRDVSVSPSIYSTVSGATGTTLGDTRQQRVRSMLEV